MQREGKKEEILLLYFTAVTLMNCLLKRHPISNFKSLFSDLISTSYPSPSYFSTLEF